MLLCSWNCGQGKMGWEDLTDVGGRGGKEEGVDEKCF